MAKFYNVQIPYRGVVPYINRRGPIASIELNAEQIEMLSGCGVVLLDPTNGRVIDVDTILGKKLQEPVVETPLEITPAVPEELEPEILPVAPTAPAQTSEDPDVQEDEKSETAPDETTPESSPEPEAEQDPEPQESAPEVEEPKPDRPASEDNTHPTEPEGALTGAASKPGEFDFTRIPDYSRLSKSKKKKLRATYAELQAQGLPETVIYAQLIKLASSTEP